MAAAAKVMTGARAKVSIKGKPVGIFNNISWGLTYGHESIYILGAYAPVETVYTSQDAVNISASGWRVINHGPHTDAAMPTLSELLAHEYFEITVFDRQAVADGGAGDKPIAKFTQCRAVAYNTTLANRQPSEVSVTFVGLKIDSDESKDNHETPNAQLFP